MKTPHLVYVVCAFGCGVVVATLFSVLRILPAWLWLGSGLVMILAGLSLRVTLRIPMLWGILVLASCIGIALTANTFGRLDTQTQALGPTWNQHVSIEGKVIAEPDLREDRQFVIVETHRVDEQEVETKVRITADRFLSFEYGDQVTFSGNIKKPEAFATEADRIFHYDTYLLQQGITATMFEPDLIAHEPGRRHPIRGLLRVKAWFLDRIERTLPFPESGLLEGLLLGVRAIPDQLYDDFRRTGIVHIVVLSGYNVMLVVNFVALALRRSPRWLQFAGVITSLLVFMIITGMQTTVIRATIMGGIAAMGRIMGGDYSITKSLALAAGVMVALNPLTLLYDISFQLSFLATIGLVYLGPMIERFFRWVPTWFELRENMVATISTSIFVMPLIAYSVGDLSIVSPLTNLIVLPFVAPAMALGFVTALASLLGPVSWLPAIPTYICLWIIIHVAVWLGSWANASIVLPAIPVWGIVVLYGGLFWVINKRSGG